MTFFFRCKVDLHKNNGWKWVGCKILPCSFNIFSLLLSENQVCMHAFRTSWTLSLSKLASFTVYLHCSPSIRSATRPIDYKRQQNFPFRQGRTHEKRRPRPRMRRRLSAATPQNGDLRANPPPPWCRGVQTRRVSHSWPTSEWQAWKRLASLHLHWAPEPMQ